MWKDLGVELSGHLLADASAALGILKRCGLGKVRHLNTNYLWVQEVMSKREVDYGKVPGSENLSDLFTKALDGETIDKHVHGTSCEYVEGKDDLAYTIHYVGAGPDMRVFHDKVGEVLKLEGDYAAWTRTDLKSRTTKTSMRGGPEWSRVVARLTLDADTNKLIKIERVEHITKNCEHALLYGGERNIMTVLLFNEGTPTSSTARSATSEGRGRCHG